MMDRGDAPKFEVYSLPEDKPAAKPNPFKIGDLVRLRDGKATNGTVSGILGNQVLIAWDDVPGDPQWYHQDFVATERRPAERNRTVLPEGAPEDRQTAKPNPFRIGQSVRLRDGTFTSGTVRGVLVDQLLIAWDDVREPQWYHQDFISEEKILQERDRGVLAEGTADDRPAAKPNPFKMGERVRLRDGTFTNGVVKGILVDQLLVAWDDGRDPQWYHQDFIATETESLERDRASQERQAEPDIVDHACRLVASMDDAQRQRFIAHIRETYK
jgi:hypothetical protein